jgi:hypothetical protein
MLSLPRVIAERRSGLLLTAGLMVLVALVAIDLSGARSINWAAVGAIAAAFGSFAAWRSASASQRTSEDALRALAISTRPDIALVIAPIFRNPAEPRLLVWIGNKSEWDARNVDAEVVMTDGTTHRATAERLGSARSEFPGGHALMLDLGLVDKDTRPADLVVRAVVRYSDARLIARYEITAVPRDPESYSWEGDMFSRGGFSIHEEQIFGPR